MALVNAYLLQYYVSGDEKCVLQAEYIQQKFGTQDTRYASKTSLAIAKAVTMARYRPLYCFIICNIDI